MELTPEIILTKLNDLGREHERFIVKKIEVNHMHTSINPFFQAFYWDRINKNQ